MITHLLVLKQRVYRGQQENAMYVRGIEHIFCINHTNPTFRLRTFHCCVPDVKYLRQWVLEEVNNKLHIVVYFILKEESLLTSKPVTKKRNQKLNHDIYIYIYNHFFVPLARISLTLSLHPSLSFIASGRSSGLHPVSSLSCCM